MSARSKSAGLSGLEVKSRSSEDGNVLDLAAGDGGCLEAVLEIEVLQSSPEPGLEERVARTDRSTEDDEIGIVAEDSKLQVRAFGVPIKSSSKLSLLAEVPSAWTEPAEGVGEPIIEPLIERSGPVDPPPAPPSGIMQRVP